MPRIPAGSSHPYLPNADLLAPRGNLPNPPKGFPVSEYAFELATVFLIVSLIVHIIATLLLAARVYTRAFPIWRFTIDDYLICIAFALMNVCFGMWYKTVSWAWGGHHPPFRTLEDVTNSSMLGSIALPFWAWSTGLVKISIGCMLLRFQANSKWRIVVHVMIALNVLLILTTGVINMFQCVPYKALWDFKGEIKNKKCWNATTGLAMLYSSSICNVFTDFVFSLMPLTFLGKIRRPLHEKVLVGGLMALGLIASAFSLSKAVINGRIPKTKDSSATLILLGLLSCLEVQTSLIAACIPTLRNSSRRFLQRIGLLNSSQQSTSHPHRPYRRRESSTIGSPNSKRNRRGQMELDEIHSHPTDSSGTKSDSERIEVQEMELSEEHYQKDPETGRIVCVTNLKGTENMSISEEKWRKDSGANTKDEGQAGRNARITR